MTGRIPVFWIVWSPQGTKPPRHRHNDKHDATKEAIRLAREHPGSEFFVMEAYGCAVKNDVMWLSTTEPAEDIPF